MSIPADFSKKYFFHFTHIENLESIIEFGLLSTNKKTELGISHFDVAAEGIQNRRHVMEVTCTPGGYVHDYVPFYFCSLNPMVLSLVNSKNIDQQFIVFFAISIDKLAGDGVVFTDASANTAIPPNFYSNPQDLEKLDWKAIESKKWSAADSDERHRRMAEVLIRDRVPIELVDTIIVWNQSMKEIVEETFMEKNIPCPSVQVPPFKSKYNFHFTKFMLGQGNHSLITGPYWLKRKHSEAIQNILELRKANITTRAFKFRNIEHALEMIDTDFCSIEELKGIYKLKTKNEFHKEDVSDHTLLVVKKLEEIEYYKASDPKIRNILRLAAYLHDIGKGPASRWEDEIQPAYPDHPADAPPMLERILSEDIKDISDYEISTICTLVVYHDLIGEIIAKGRDIQQLVNIVNDETMLEMLATINLADVSAISPIFKRTYLAEVDEIKSKTKKAKNL